MGNIFRKLQIQLKMPSFKETIRSYISCCFNGVSDEMQKYKLNMEENAKKAFYSVIPNEVWPNTLYEFLPMLCFMETACCGDRLYALTYTKTYDFVVDKNNKEYYDVTVGCEWPKENYSGDYLSKPYLTCLLNIYFNTKKLSKQKKIVGFTDDIEFAKKYVNFDYSPDMSNDEIKESARYANDKGHIIRRLIRDNYNRILGGQSLSLFAANFFGDWKCFNSYAWKIYQHQMQYGTMINNEVFEELCSYQVRLLFENGTLTFDGIDFSKKQKIELIRATMKLDALYSEYQTYSRVPEGKSIKELKDILPQISEDEAKAETEKLRKLRQEKKNLYSKLNELYYMAEKLDKLYHENHPRAAKNKYENKIRDILPNLTDDQVEEEFEKLRKLFQDEQNLKLQLQYEHEAEEAENNEWGDGEDEYSDEDDYDDDEYIDEEEDYKPGKSRRANQVEWEKQQALMTLRSQLAQVEVQLSSIISKMGNYNALSKEYYELSQQRRILQFERDRLSNEVHKLLYK